MNGQVVMCPGYNDGEELKRTLNDLLKYVPTMESVSVVPVGITKFREDLPRLTLVDKAKAIETIEIIEDIQRKAMEKCNMHFAQASDEFYLIAERDTLTLKSNIKQITTPLYFSFGNALQKPAVEHCFISTLARKTAAYSFISCRKSTLPSAV